MNTLTEVYGEPISVYTKEQAIEDGILIRVGFLSNLKLPVLFTTNLFSDVKDNYREIITRGLDLLNKKDPEDDGFYKLRVIEKDRIWVITNTEGVTFMKPEDYWKVVKSKESLSLKLLKSLYFSLFSKNSLFLGVLKTVHGQHIYREDK